MVTSLHKKIKHWEQSPLKFWVTDPKSQLVPEAPKNPRAAREFEVEIFATMKRKQLEQEQQESNSGNQGTLPIKRVQRITTSLQRITSLNRRGNV